MDRGGDIRMVKTHMMARTEHGLLGYLAANRQEAGNISVGRRLTLCRIRYKKTGRCLRTAQRDKLLPFKVGLTDSFLLMPLGIPVLP